MRSCLLHNNKQFLFTVYIAFTNRIDIKLNEEGTEVDTVVSWNGTGRRCWTIYKVVELRHVSGKNMGCGRSQCECRIIVIPLESLTASAKWRFAKQG